MLLKAVIAKFKACSPKSIFLPLVVRFFCCFFSNRSILMPNQGLAGSPVGGPGAGTLPAHLIMGGGMMNSSPATSGFLAPMHTAANSIGGGSGLFILSQHIYCFLLVFCRPFQLLSKEICLLFGSSWSFYAIVQ